MATVGAGIPTLGTLSGIPYHVSMLTILESVKGLLKLSSVCNDNKVFRLHYKVTTAVMIAFCLLVTFKHYIGDPINCIVEGGEQMEKAMNSYCWIQSTFTVPSRAFGKKIGEQIPHPGVATPEEGDELKYHKYYQWVCFMLLFQATLFYFPHYLWKTWEGGKCQMLVQDLQSPVTPEETRYEQQKRITDYFKVSLNHHNIYASRFFCCEVLNFVNVVAQIYFTDLFLGYEFTTYGSRVVQYMITKDQEDRPDPMALVFPKVTKCTFHKYGASGTVQRIDNLCVLSINILNEKIYVFLWFWFIVLAVVTGLALLCRLAVLLSPQLQRQWFMWCATLASKEDVNVVAPKCQIGDWFILCQIGKNMDPPAFQELICMLALSFEGKDAVNSTTNDYKNRHAKIPNITKYVVKIG